MGGRKNAWIFVLAGLIALGAAWFANNWIMEKYMISEGSSEDTEPVVVASMDIQFGQLVRPAALSILQMPKGTSPGGAFHAIEEVNDKVALQAIYAGEIVLSKKLRSHLGGSTLAAVISPGKRAVTVRVNDVIGVAGFLLPNNRVDVISTYRDGNKTKSRILLQDVKVLAVDQTSSPDKDKPVIVRAVTLELGPKEGERLVKATAEGAVQLALRNPMEDGLVDEELEPQEEPERLAANLPVPATVTTDVSWITLIRGTRIEKADVLP